MCDQRKHNLTFGFGYRRLQQNSLTYQNARGSYSFSRIADQRIWTPTASR